MTKPHRFKALETTLPQALACVLEAVDMEEARVWRLELMGEVALPCAVVVTSLSLRCHPQMQPQDRTTISKDEAAPLDMLEIHLETSKVTGETSPLKDKLPSKINKVKWATLAKANSNKVDSNQVIAIVPL